MSFKRRLLLLVMLVTAVLGSWNILRSWVAEVLVAGSQLVHVLDVAVVFAAGIAVIIVLSRSIDRYAGAYLGPTHVNAVRLLFQVTAFSTILLIALSTMGVSLINVLVGAGFLGIVIGLAAQTTLGNLFSGLMLLASRPFNTGDRITLVNAQYGRAVPSLSHGWLEPAYTGYVKEITLMHTKLMTDANNLITIPNTVVAQSLILNPTHDKHSHIELQFEIPITIPPKELHKIMQHQLSKIVDFSGEEERFEILEVSSSTCLLVVSYRTERRHEREMRSHLLEAMRLALVEIQGMTQKRG
jgi:small-conductance mechanosensitive channel